jgi:hypothetical protein
VVSRVVSLAVGVLLCACPQLGIDDDGEGETDTDGLEELVPPAINEAQTELRIPVTRADDLVLPVSDIALGITDLVLDGLNVGPLPTTNRIGRLTADTLTLRLTGGMVASSHTIRLRTRAGAEPIESREIAIHLVPAITSTPTATLGDDVVFEADSLFTAGYDGEGLLVAIDLEAEGPVALVHRGAGTGWNLVDPVGFVLDGLHVDASPGASVHAHLEPGGADPSDDRVRVVWLAGIEADSIVVADSPWLDPRPMPRRILDVDEIAGSSEYARLRRPLVLGDDVVVEALLATDVEQPHPGDRTLVLVRIAGSPVVAGEPRLATVEGRNDIDALGPTIDLLEHAGDGPRTFAARVAGARPVVFDLDRDSGELATRLSLSNDSTSILSDLALPLVTVLGAFDSRQVFAALDGGAEGARLVLRHFDDGESTGATDASPTAEQLAGIGEPSSAAVATLVGGAPIYLVPMGVDAPVHAFVSTGPVPIVAPLPGVQCDEIAVPVTTEGNRSGTTSFACRRGREVSLGTLQLPM